LVQVFAGYIEGKVARLPWCEVPLHAETTPLSLKLSRLNREGFLTINSQPRVNGARSDDPVHGWGGPGGYCYQKAYIEVSSSECC
jgi:methylenetetrahydrofolate reductase (NADPH)